MEPSDISFENTHLVLTGTIRGVLANTSAQVILRSIVVKGRIEGHPPIWAGHTVRTPNRDLRCTVASHWNPPCCDFGTDTTVRSQLGLSDKAIVSPREANESRGWHRRTGNDQGEPGPCFERADPSRLSGRRAQSKALAEQALLRLGQGMCSEATPIGKPGYRG